MSEDKVYEPLTDEQRKMAIEELTDLQFSGDAERAHFDADMILCDVLRTLGYHDIVDAWWKVEKWYA